MKKTGFTADMSLRDWFAGVALQALLADPNTSGTPEIFSDWAYKYADAMMEARAALSKVEG